jgi:hypothetical protein
MTASNQRYLAVSLILESRNPLFDTVEKEPQPQGYLLNIDE